MGEEDKAEELVSEYVKGMREKKRAVKGVREEKRKKEEARKGVGC